MAIATPITMVDIALGHFYKVEKVDWKGKT
jgi:hypothetical protein